MTSFEKQKWLALARAALEEKKTLNKINKTKKFAWNGIFISIWKKRKLRGGEGILTAKDDLMPNVNTIEDRIIYLTKMASKDIRFPKLKLTDFKSLIIEIDILSVHRKKWSKFQILRLSKNRNANMNDIWKQEKDSILIEQIRSPHSLFYPNFQIGLPHDLKHRKWDLVRNLESLCIQLGMPSNSWEDEKKTNIYSISTISFSEPHVDT